MPSPVHAGRCLRTRVAGAFTAGVFTSDSHDVYPGTITAALGAAVRYRTNRHLNNHLEQDHSGSKQRIRPMGGFKSVESATRFCRVHDEVGNFLRPRSRRNEGVFLAQRRLRGSALQIMFRLQRVAKISDYSICYRSAVAYQHYLDTTTCE
jgi:hypothetical protein